MRPTRWWVLVASAAIAGVVGYLLARARYGDLPLVPRTVPITLLVVAAVELLLAVGTRNRLVGRPGTRPVEPLAVARYAALARASSLAGSVVGGFYTGYVAWTVSRRNVLEAATADTVVGALAALTGLLVVAAALRLERVCRVPGR